MYVNEVRVIGNLTRDPEMKTLPSGLKITSFSVATNRVWYNDKKEKMEEVEYHNVVVFGRQAETSAQYLKKGSQVRVAGRLKTQSWDDAGTGKKMYRTEIVAENVQFGSRAQGNTAPQTSQNGSGTPKPAETIEYPEDELNPEDIPF